MLEELRSGITPDWPAKWVERIKNYSSLDVESQLFALEGLFMEMKEGAFPFLLNRLKEGSPEEQGVAFELIIKLNHPDAPKKVLEQLKDENGDVQLTAKAWALGKTGRAVEGLILWNQNNLEESLQLNLLDQAIAELSAKPKSNPDDELLKKTSILLGLFPNELRLTTLKGLALLHLKRLNEAENLFRELLTLYPKDEYPHALVAEILWKHEAFEESMRHWESILKIPPESTVYEINALVRTSRNYEMKNQFKKAATTLEKALKLYQQGSLVHDGWHWVGATVVTLQSRIQWLQDQEPSSPK